MNHDREQHLPQTNTQEKLLHSGNFEGKLQEDHYDKENAFSVQEFKDLDTDQLQQVVPAPETSGALILTDEERSSREFQEKTDYYKQKSAETETGWQPTGSELLTETVEKKKKSNRGLFIKIGSAAATLAVAATAYFGTQSGDKDQNSPAPTQPVATAEATNANTEPAKNTDEAEPVVDKLPVDVIESGLFESLSPEKQAEIKALRAMTVEQFRALPLEQQFMFAQYVYDNNAPRTLHAMKEEGFKLGEYADRVVEPSETNNAQQVVDSAAIMIDVAGNLYNEKGEYDVDTARKMVILSVASGPAFEAYDQDLQTRATGLAMSTTTEISASKLYDTENDTHMKVNLISKTGISAQTTYQLMHFKDTAGKDRATWRWTFSVKSSDGRYENILK